MHMRATRSKIKDYGARQYGFIPACGALKRNRAFMNLEGFHCVFLILLIMATIAPVHALKLCVVGGGAAGYFAAIQAAQSLREVCGGQQLLTFPYV
jgi:hypothetical protein